MTYIVFDGKVVISDCLVSTSAGSGIIGRKPVNDKGMVQYNKYAPTVDIYYDDCRKQIFPVGATYQGKPLKMITLAGSAQPLQAICGALDAGVDFDDIIKVDVNVQPKAKRHIFNGNSSFMILTDDNKGLLVYCNGDSVKVDERRFMHMGSGTTVVDSVRGLIPGIMQDTAPELTSLEAFVLASGQTETVSEAFDYYIPATGEYKTNQRLTERQAEFILNRIQKRMKLADTYRELTYVNRTPQAL